MDGHAHTRKWGRGSYHYFLQRMSSSACLIVVISLLSLFLAEGCHDVEGETCTHSITELRALVRGTFAANSTVCVTLEPNSAETLDYTETPLPFNVVITGNNSTVSCVNDPQVIDVEDLTSYTHFPLLFHNASFVAITGLHFDGCKRPLQFQQIQSIKISSSSFT